MAVISKDSKVTIGAAMTVVLALCGATGTFVSKINGLEYRLESFGQRMESLERGRYTVEQATAAAQRFALENPGARVPDPANPDRVFVVYSGGVEAAK